MALPDVDVRRFTRAEYERLAEDGFLEPSERVELIDGIIYNMPPQSGPHAPRKSGPLPSPTRGR